MKKVPAKTPTPEVLPATPVNPVKEKKSDRVFTVDPEITEELSGDLVPSRLPVARETRLDPSIADPLKIYLAEVARYPLLTPEAEFQLVTRMREQGDIVAAKALVSANLRLVVKIAMEYKNIYTNLLDLIQEGNIGLMKAVSKFDPTKGARLSYYASWWIRSFILKYLLDNFRLVKLGTTQAQKKLFYHLMREKERLESQGMLAGPKLLAEKFDVKEKEVIEMQQRLSSFGSEMSLDAPVSATDEGGKLRTYQDLLPSEAELPETQLANQQLIMLLREKLPEIEALLDEKERRILHDRILSENPKTLQEIANLYGLTRERARQIETRVIARIRTFFTESRAI